MTEGVAYEAPTLTTKDFAERYGIHRRTVLLWIATGRAPKAIKVGREWRFRPSDLIAWEHARIRGGDAA